VPPPQMTANLKAGHLDGFCAGEPWNSVAVQSRTGWCVATSAELEPGHPEKVLMVRKDFAQNRAAEHVALIAALLVACEFCDQPANHEFIAKILARPEYVGVDAAVLQRGLAGKMDFGHGLARHVANFCVFHRDEANEPNGSRAAWVLEMIRASGLCKDPLALDFTFGRRIFRPDIYDQATRLRATVPCLTNHLHPPRKIHENKPDLALP
jgi:ABC-type nitrate/sulfonate/bicarbonate transport system substrate-binding protein